MARPGHQPIAVLLVDDDPTSATRLRHHLRDDDARLDTTPDGLTHVETLAAGVEELTTGEYDVLFLDLDLPASTGMEPLDRVLDVAPTVPIIVLTDVDDHDRGRTAIQRGAQDFLVKGAITGDLLTRSVRYALERHEQTTQLQRQKDQLEFFNAILQHDLLNGMNVIKMRAELLEGELDGESREYVETVLTWSDSIIDLTEKVRTVLDTLTSETDAELHPVELAPIVEREATRVRGMDDDVAVTVDVPANATVIADALLADVIGNLLTNAVEHNDTDGLTVAVSASVSESSVTLSISDDGAGIPAADRDRLFERGETGSRSGGSGFGLYFVGSMVETYGGEITVTESPDGGAEFLLELPAA